MRKLVLVALLIMAVVAATIAAPTEDTKKHMELEKKVRALEGQESEESNDHLRFRRVTCDLLGFLGNSACAANCLSMGKAGGTCHGGICVCRRDTFGEQLQKRWPDSGVTFDFNPTLKPSNFDYLNRQK